MSLINHQNCYKINISNKQCASKHQNATTFAISQFIQKNNLLKNLIKNRKNDYVTAANALNTKYKSAMKVGSITFCYKATKTMLFNVGN